MDETSIIGLDVLLLITGIDVNILSLTLEAIVLNKANWLLGINVNSNLLSKYGSFDGYVVISEL